MHADARVAMSLRPLSLFPSVLVRGPVSWASYEEEDTCMLMRGVQKSSGLTQWLVCFSVCCAGYGFEAGCVCRGSTRAFDLRNQVSGGERRTKWVLEPMRGWCCGGFFSVWLAWSNPKDSKVRAFSSLYMWASSEQGGGAGGAALGGNVVLGPHADAQRYEPLDT